MIDANKLAPNKRTKLAKMTTSHLADANMGRMIMKHSITALLAGLSAIAIVVAPARAQEAPADENGIQDIIVTAQKKAENLQDVPISIAAVTGAAVADAHAVTLQGLQGTVPNISIGNFSNTPNNAVITSAVSALLNLTPMPAIPSRSCPMACLNISRWVHFLTFMTWTGSRSCAARKALCSERIPPAVLSTL